MIATACLILSDGYLRAQTNGEQSGEFAIFFIALFFDYYTIRMIAQSL